MPERLPANDDTWLTTDQVLEYLNVNLKTVYRLLKAGKLPGVRVGRQWRFKKRDLDAFLTASHDRPRQAPAPHKASILVVDDEDAVRELIATALRTNPQYDVAVAADGPAALSMLRSQAFDALMTDLKMPGMDGMTLIREARAMDAGMAIVILTAVPSQASAIDAVNLGVGGYLTKPFRVPQILDVVDKAVRQRVIIRD